VYGTGYDGGYIVGWGTLALINAALVQTKNRSRVGGSCSRCFSVPTADIDLSAVERARQTYPRTLHIPTTMRQKRGRMMAQVRLTGIAAALLGTAMMACRPGPPTSSGTEAQVRRVLSQALPAMNGRGLRVTVLEVTYGPGGSSRPHRHPCAVVGSVIAGTLRSRVEGEPEALYRAGESFYEAPNGVHLVSANASDRDPVRFLAYFTCDHDAPLSEEVP
jgi:quercetin dioxygenase-like cupin family protein